MFVVLSKPDCPYCDMATDLLKEKGIDYEKVDITLDLWAKTLMLEAGFNTVPQVFDHSGKWIGGYRDLEIYFDTR